jgi:hypothetical protein
MSVRAAMMGYFTSSAACKVAGLLDACVGAVLATCSPRVSPHRFTEITPKPTQGLGRDGGPSGCHTNPISSPVRSAFAQPHPPVRTLARKPLPGSPGEARLADRPRGLAGLHTYSSSLKLCHAAHRAADTAHHRSLLGASGVKSVLNPPSPPKSYAANGTGITGLPGDMQHRQTARALPTSLGR